jgi:cysteine desulfurase
MVSILSTSLITISKKSFKLNPERSTPGGLLPPLRNLEKYRCISIDPIRKSIRVRSTKRSTEMAVPGKTQSRCIYLDYSATTPIFPEVAEAMKPYLTEFGNPSSNHPYGRKCKEAVELARQHVAHLVNAQPSEIYFCSCGTEADNWAIWGAIAAYRKENPGAMPHVLTSAIEHPAVLEQLKMLEGLGLVTYTVVGVNSEGIVYLDSIMSSVTPQTCLITLMHSNNEVGSLQPIAKVAAFARSKGILMHSDAAQSIGKVHVDVKELGVDMLTIVGHKFGAPKGVAALYIKDGVPETKVSNFLCGGGQENGRRAGTENVLLIVGLGKAAEIAYNELERTKNHMAHLRIELKRLLIEGTDESCVQVNGPVDSQWKLPNTLSISFKGISSSQLLGELSEVLAASAGAACHSSDGPIISSVLSAMQVPNEYALGTLRLSVGRHTTEEDVKRGADLIIKKVVELRSRG